MAILLSVFYMVTMILDRLVDFHLITMPMFYYIINNVCLFVFFFQMYFPFYYIFTNRGPLFIILIYYKMNWEHLQNEHRIRTQQVLDRITRENTLSFLRA